MNILASYNIKGGVGKTAATVNLAFLCAAENYRTLIWDLDPQGAASYYFRIKPRVKSGAKGLLQRKHELSTAIKATDFDNLDLIPADFSYRNMDLYLEDMKNPTRRLRKILKQLTDEYDCIFLDCPPSISLVSENIFTAADALLIPTIPTTLSLRTLEQLQHFLEKQENNPLLLPFFSMVDRRKNLHRIITERPPKTLPPFLDCQIPYASDIEQMGIRRAPLSSYAAHSRSNQAYIALWSEIKTHLGLPSIGKSPS